MIFLVPLYTPATHRINMSPVASGLRAAIQGILSLSVYITHNSWISYIFHVAANKLLIPILKRVCALSLVRNVGYHCWHNVLSLCLFHYYHILSRVLLPQVGYEISITISQQLQGTSWLVFVRTASWSTCKLLWWLF